MGSNFISVGINWVRLHDVGFSACAERQGGASADADGLHVAARLLLE